MIEYKEAIRLVVDYYVCDVCGERAEWPTDIHMKGEDDAHVCSALCLAKFVREEEDRLNISSVEFGDEILDDLVKLLTRAGGEDDN